MELGHTTIASNLADPEAKVQKILVIVQFKMCLFPQITASSSFQLNMALLDITTEISHCPEDINLSINRDAYTALLLPLPQNYFFHYHLTRSQ